MLKLGALLLNLERADWETEQFGKEVFQSWHQHYLVSLLEAIRIKNRMDARKIHSTIDVDFCNAAALILDAASDEIQDRFLRSTPQNKRKFTDAVLADGGLYDRDGRWVEVPVV